MALQLGDVCIWTWAATCVASPTRLKVIDISLSRKDFDVIVQSENTGTLFYERECDLLVIARERSSQCDIPSMK